MAYARILALVLSALATAYYGMIVGHLFGLWDMTKRRITFARLCIPFYYWIVSQNNNKPNNKKQ